MKEFSIYIHIPFCISKCSYCDFNSFSNMDNMIDEYVNALLKEIESDSTFSEKDICKTIYIGGGTPSYIDSKYIIQILNLIYSKYIVCDNVEITIEVNPSSVNYEKFKDYFNIGINRISMGLQTTNNDILKIIGRRHIYEEFVEKYNMAREVGFKNINVDIMVGLPNQNENGVIEDITKVISLNPEHVSCYSLILYENVPLYSLVKQEKYILPNEEEERNMIYSVQKMLKEAGYEHYEISNYAKPSMDSKHNLMCWNQYEYIGFGAGAHSFVDNVRFCNEENLQKYITNNEKIVLEKMNKQDLMKEYMILGLRLLKKIDVDRFKKIYSENMFNIFEKEIQMLENEGYIWINKTGSIYLTQRGVDFNNYVCEQFI